MIGFRYRAGIRAGQEAVQRFAPVFESGRPRAGYTVVMAKDGYAVGAIQVDSDQFVKAIRVAFMRIDGDRLDTKDSYVSDWIGKPTGQSPKTLNSKGAWVLGVQSRFTGNLHAVGLIYQVE